MDHIRNRRRLSIRSTVTALVVATAATYADGAAARDCVASTVQADVEDLPLTRAERITRLDQAFHDSLARFDECQNVDSAVSAAPSQDAGAESAGGETAGAGDDASGQSGAAEGIRNGETPEAAEPATTGAAMESVAAEGVQGTEAQKDAERTESDTERLPGSGPGSGEVPDDIPEPDNDSVLEAQIRRAAMEETDPRIRAELWNEYRKYKGLPTRPLPDDDGEPSDAQNSQ